LNPVQQGLYINPIRVCAGNTTQAVYYNTTTKELTYTAPVSSGSGASVSGYLANSVIFANTTGYLSNTANILFYQANNNLYVSSNVGIGVNPQYPLHVNIPTIGATVARFGGVNNIVDIYAGSGSTSYIGDAAAHNAFGFNTPGNWLDIWTNNSEKLRVDSIGNMILSTSVGGITPATGNGQNLYVSGNTYILNDTVSTSTITGALVVDGGAGIAGNVYSNAIYTNGLYYAANNLPIPIGGGSSGSSITIGQVNAIARGFALP
jgi:hypothetical protein